MYIHVKAFETEHLFIKISPRSVIAECQVDIKIFPDEVDVGKVPDAEKSQIRWMQKSPRSGGCRKVPDQVDAEKVPDQVDADRSGGCTQS